MVRNKGVAPTPPVKPKYAATKVAVADSLVLMFDELTRNSAVLQEGSEDKFLQFAGNQTLCMKRWEHAEGELIRMTTELERCEGELRKQEMKLGQARDLLASETTLRKKAEMERDHLNQKWELVRELISQPGQNGETFNDETRVKLQKLEASLCSRRGTTIFSPGVGYGLAPVNEMDSTCSILDASDLSFDNTQGSVLGGEESRLRSGRAYKRKSSGGGAAMAAARQEKRNRISQGQRKSLEAMAARRSVGADRYNERNIDSYIPAAPPLEDVVMNWQNRHGNKVLPSTPSIVTLTPSQGSTVTLVPQTPSTPYDSANPVRRTHSQRGMNRKHQFVQKVIYKSETCGPCQRRIKFGKPSYKCRDCRAVSHVECKDRVPLPCVPVGSATKTPSKPGHGMVLADHTPPTSPMVPAIIVYCVNEIEKRGLDEVGIYRVPGSDREVKDLREKFLAGRGCPNLGNVEVHVLCGVVKDFLRHLKEPLIPSSMWFDFTSVVSNPDCTVADANLFQAVTELPRPNRDTMAFLMLHLQKVSSAKETKMSRSNLAKILGPTIIGYSSIDAQPDEIMREVGIQAATMEKLIGIDAEYWNTFLNQGDGEPLFSDTRFLSPATPDMQASIFRTPGDGGLTPRIPLKPSVPNNRIFASPVLY